MNLLNDFKSYFHAYTTLNDQQVHPFFPLLLGYDYFAHSKKHYSLENYVLV